MEKPLLKSAQDLAKTLFSPETRGALLRKMLIPSLLASLITGALIILTLGGASFIAAKTADTRLNDIARAAGTAGSANLERRRAEEAAAYALGVAEVLDSRLRKVKDLTELMALSLEDIYSHPKNFIPRKTRIISVAKGGGGAPFVFFTGRQTPQNLQEALRAANAEGAARAFGKIEPAISGIYAAGESGYVFCADIRASADNFMPVGNVSEIPWYKGAKDDAGAVFWTGVYERDGELVLSCGAPFYERTGGGAVFRGAAGCDVALADFAPLVNEGATRFVVSVLDGEGREILASNEADAQTDFIALAPLETVNWKVRAALKDAAFAHDAPLDAALDIERINENARDEIFRVLKIGAIAAGALFMLMFVFYIAFLMSFTRRVSTPLARFTNNIAVLTEAGGNVEPPSDALEFVSLSKAFNSAIEKLKESIARRERRSSELLIAAHIQHSVIPPSIPEFAGHEGNIDLYAMMCPAKETGADFYDYFFIDTELLALVIGDVSGKGINAAMFMLLVQGVLKNNLLSELSCEDAMNKLNVHICERNGGAMFATIWLGVLNITTGRLDYVSAGHNPPLLKTGNYNFSFLYSSSAAPPAGVFEDSKYSRHSFSLKKGDELFLYTDGITDARNKENEPFGDERLKKYLAFHYKDKAEVQLKGLFEEVKQFSADVPQNDDITMLALRYKVKSDARAK